MKSRSKKSSTELVPLSLRLPPHQRDALSAVAAHENKSMNSVIVEFLEEKLEAYDMAKLAHDKDPLAMVYFAADAIESYTEVVRAGVLRAKIMSGDLEVTEENFREIADMKPGLLRPEGVPKQSHILSDEERELVGEIKGMIDTLQTTVAKLTTGKKG